MNQDLGMRPGLLAPSILSSDFSKLAEEVALVAGAGADWVHVDVMDGHFVPNLTIGAPVVKSLRPATELPLDVHLMIEEPGRYLPDFLAAGADWITFHVETQDDPRLLMQRIHDEGKKGGLALRPATPVGDVLPFIDVCDMVLVMTVEPGFGGQSFMVEPLEKIAVLRAEAARLGRDLEIEVDGGIDLTTLPLAREAGANVFVAGSAIFGTDDVADTVRRFKSLIG